MSFVHLHTHSFYSLLDGAAGLEQLINQAGKLKFRHLALTDHNALYGAVEFYKLAREANIHPIIGAEVTLAGGTNVVLLVKSETGYRNLCQLLSAGRLDGGHLKFKLDLKKVLHRKEGLFLLSGGHKGYLWKLVQGRKLKDAQTYCRKMKAILGENFCIELQQFRKNDLIVNLRLRDLAYQYQIPLVATNDVHLLQKSDWPLRRVLHAIDQNTLIDKITTAGSPEQYLKSAAEMQALFKEFPGTIRNTEKIARQCTFEFKLGTPVFPKIHLPEKETSYSYLWKQSFHGAQERYHILTRELIDRLSRELNTINELGFADYFLIVKDIVDFCNRESIPCVGRGSAGDSIISYVLGITQVDPLRYNLYFERFLNRERSDPPDIDLDICWKNRDRVLDYVYRTYGDTRTAMICTFNTFQLRSSIRDAARAFGFPEDEITAITKHLPHYGVERLSRALEHIPECRHIRQNVDTLEQALKYARRIADFPRHLSIHPGGVIIAPDDIRNYTPLQVAGKGIVVSQYDMYSIEPLGLVKMDLLGVRSLSVVTDSLQLIKSLYQRHTGKLIPRKDVADPGGERPEERSSGSAPLQRELWSEDAEKRPYSLFKKRAGEGDRPPQLNEGREKSAAYRYDVKKQRIIKLDLNTCLTPERFPFLDTGTQCLSPLDMRMIPENDSNVIALLRSGLSMGCFQTESPAMRGLLKKMQIDGMDDVIIAVALIRPGAADSGMKDVYIERRAGLKEVEYVHPALKPVLEETYGGIVYQEQVMQVAAAVAGFSLSQADVLRRAMTKSRNHKILTELHNDFIKGARQQKLNKTQAEEIWQFLTNFVGYGFNKAHSCTYGVIAYQTAFLKYYFPVQYMTAVLNNRGGFYSRAAYIAECRRMGIRLLPPDVNRSQEYFTCEGDTIICGLEPVFELTDKTRTRILAKRAQKPFGDYYDFMQRAQPREKEAANLIKCGALRSLNPNEPELLLKNKLYFKNKRNRNLTESLMHRIRLKPYSKYQRILNEIEMLDFALTDHPLVLFESKINREEVTPSYQLEEHRGGRIKFAGWLVTHRRVATKKNEYMKFLTLEDMHGLCEAVLFSKTYKQYGHLTRTYGPYLITGVVQSRLPGEANLIVEKLQIVRLDKDELEEKLLVKEGEEAFFD